MAIQIFYWDLVINLCVTQKRFEASRMLLCVILRAGNMIVYKTPTYFTSCLITSTRVYKAAPGGRNRVLQHGLQKILARDHPFNINIL